MAVQTNGLIWHLRKIGLLLDDAGMPDGQLLKSFLAQRDETAFAALMRRHGPMVLGVCRRILRNSHDAEDAFQATFLVLVRKARSIGRPELLGNWLYGVAYRTALAARGAAAKRRLKERDMAKPEAVEENGTQELAALLDRELVQLPEKYRVPIVLCDLEGKTRKEAAQKLGWPEGTMHGRLARGRMLLARRLRRQGIAFSGGTMTALLAQNAASASVSASVAVSTIKAASLLAAGQKAAAGLISPEVAALAEGVVKVMLMSKLKAVVVVVLVLGFLLTGATVLTLRTASVLGGQAPAVEVRRKAPEKPEREKQPFTAWGTEVGGLQAGLGYDPGQKRAYRHGETVRLVLRVRNVSKKEVEFVCCRQYFMEEPPTMRDGQGRSVRLPRSAGTPKPRQEKVSLAPGKEIELYELKFKLRPAGENGDEDNDIESLDFAGTVFTFCGTGKFLIQYERLIDKPWAGPEPDPILRRLATGKLELEVKEAEKLPHKREANGEKNAKPPASEKKENEAVKLKPDPTNLEKWTQGKGVVDVCFAGPWQDPLKLRSSLKTKVPETDRDFRLACGEGGGENRSFVQVSMTVTPENVQRLLALQAELKPRGYLMDPKETRVWS